ncbi:LuxR C-terminal-related transcriptional regulator [Cellulosimicrobium cellulans]|uniref:LuxR C-terminal-related transcriptional regulator n=1 Tax=Cellulosimicrobium cellulans TaxID=1710 RepID=UPI00365644D7
MSPLPDEVAAHAHSGLHVDVVGRPMSGRTALLDVVADRLKELGRRVVRVNGIRSFRERPLAALNVADLGAGAPAQTSAAELVRSLVRLLDARASVLVIDDLDDLDTASVGAVLAAHRETGAPAVTARRVGTDDSQAVRDLLATLHPGITVEVGARPFDEIHELVHDSLPGPVDPAVVASVAVLAGRLPGLTTALVAAARSEGSIVLTDGMWRSVRPLSSRSLGRVLAPIVSDLDPAEHDALAVLALANHPAPTTADRLVGGEMLLRLERRGLVALSDDSSIQTVAVVPPALAEYIPRSQGGLWRAHIHRRIAAQSRTAAGREGPAGDPHVADSVLSRRFAEHWEAARRALHQTWLAAPSASNAVELLTATLVCPPSTPTPEEILAGTEATESDPRDVIRLHASFAQYLVFHRRSLSDALAHLDARTHHHADAEYDAVRAHLQLLFDEVPGHETVDTLLSAATGSSRATLGAVRVEIALARGATSTARGLLHSRTEVPSMLAATSDSAPALTAILAGEVAAGTRLALEGVAAARTLLDPGAFEAFAYAAATGLVLSGRFHELDALVASSLSLTTRTPHEEHFRSGVLAMAAIAAGWQGRAEYGRRLARQARALNHRPGPYPAMVHGPMLAIARAGDLTEGSEAIWETAEERFAHGYVTAGVFAAVAALERRPDGARGRHVVAAARDVESPLLQALVRYAVALGDGDADALADVESDFSTIEAHSYAVRAAVSAAMVRLASADRAQALAAIGRAWAVGEEISGERAGFYQPYVKSLDLSPRELETIELASTGLTAAEIGAGLNISPRTVENHLFAAYRKLGMDNRDDLRLAVSTWLAPQRA